MLGVKQGDMDKGRRGAMGGADFRYTWGLPFLSLSLFEWTRYDKSGNIIGHRRKSPAHPQRPAAQGNLQHGRGAHAGIFLSLKRARK